MNKKTKKYIKDGIIALVILAVVLATIGIIVHFTTPKPPLITTTYILSKFYPLTGYLSGNTKVLFYTNTSPVGCISYAVIKNYAYNVTMQGVYPVNETKITNATEVKKLYTIIGYQTLGTNQEQVFLAKSGTNGTDAIILQNQTLLCK